MSSLERFGGLHDGNGSFCSGIFTKTDNRGTSDRSGRIFWQGIVPGGGGHRGDNSGNSAAEDERTVIGLDYGMADRRK